MVVAVVEVVNSKILLPDEGAIIKQVMADKEDMVLGNSAEPATTKDCHKKNINEGGETAATATSQQNNHNDCNGNAHNNYNSYSNT
jgi:hypothetical protein